MGSVSRSGGICQDFFGDVGKGLKRGISGRGLTSDGNSDIISSGAWGEVSEQRRYSDEDEKGQRSKGS